MTLNLFFSTSSSTCIVGFFFIRVIGKARNFMIYLGVGDYRKTCEKIEKNKYPGFVMK